MARQNPKDISEELKQQEDEIYGEETVGGSAGPSEVMELDDNKTYGSWIEGEEEEEEEQEE